MADFLRGRRRRLGVVVLATALVALLGWVRSHFLMDVLEWPSGKTTTEVFLSTGQSIAWQRRITKEPEPTSMIPSWTKIPAFSFHNPTPDLKWHWRRFGVGFCEIPQQPPNVASVTMWVISYWYFITPLTIVSVWLFAVTPPKSDPSKVRLADLHEPMADRTYRAQSGLLRFLPSHDGDIPNL